MLPINFEVIAWLAVIANLFVQLTKGLVSEAVKNWIPPVLAVVMSGIGLGLAAYTGRDLIAGLAEGFIGACSAVGLYELTSAIPGVNKIFNGGGWIPKA